MTHWNDRFGGYPPEDLALAFLEGREFRMFKEFDFPANGSFVIKAVVPVNTVFYDLNITLDNGALRLATVAGGTPGGVFTPIPVFLTNNMTPGEDRRDTWPPFPPGSLYTPQVQVSSGGTHTGGTELDVQRWKVGTESIGHGLSSFRAPRGIAPGTYHFRLTGLQGGANRGVFRAVWEERVPDLS